MITELNIFYVFEFIAFIRLHDAHIVIFIQRATLQVAAEPFWYNPSVG